MMPLAYSIADGIMFGMLGYVALKLLSGKSKDVNFVTIIIAIVFLIKFIVG
jgi:AGZA family xanthine/uracil permease-like MFS transporter